MTDVMNIQFGGRCEKHLKPKPCPQCLEESSQPAAQQERNGLEPLTEMNEYELLKHYLRLNLLDADYYPCLAALDKLTNMNQWTPYLKDGETPFERFMRERADLDALMTLHSRAIEAQQERKPDPLAPRGWRGSMNEKETP